MKIKKEDIKKIINILESKYNELEEGEYFEFNGKELVKDNFKLPKFWWIRVTKENQKELTKWRGCTGDYMIPIGYVTGIYNGSWGPKEGTREQNPTPDERFGEEITYEQFKKFY